MSSDNLDRTFRDLSKAIEQLPPAAIGVVLNSWQRRIDYIKNQLNYTRSSSPIANKEIDILKNCIAEIRAANLIDKGNGAEALRILLNNDL